MNIRDEELSRVYKEIWKKLSTELKVNIKICTLNEKAKNERDFNLLIDSIIKFIYSFPKEESKRKLWRKRGNDYLDKIILKQKIFKLGIIDKNMKESFIKSTKSFIKRAKGFDENISYEDIGQAMRNVWIINILQKSFGEELKLTDGTFGYSMLYPYTDNYLDDFNISIDEKKKFNERFSRRLKGELLNFENNHEKQVYQLVECIESQFNRESYPLVYEKLLLIHKGQQLSLDQQLNLECLEEKFNLEQQETESRENDILGISIEKGGASVLADGYLIRGNMSEEEEMFSYGYGFSLQLADDLQDVKEDKKNNHRTLISELAGECELDYIVNKLINLTLNVVDDAKCFLCENANELKDLIKNNCTYMILFAIVDNKEYFSKAYIEDITKYLPFTLEYSINLKDMIVRKINSINKENYKFSLEEALLYFME